MATGSGTSSSIGSRGAGASGQPGASASAGAGAGAQPLCPFCKTSTIVERTWRTIKHPNIPFYTCKNRDWGNNKCDFFMWKPKPVSDGGCVDAAALMAGFQDLANNVLLLSNVVQAVSVECG